MRLWRLRGGQWTEMSGNTGLPNVLVTGRIEVSGTVTYFDNVRVMFALRSLVSG